MPISKFSRRYAIINSIIAGAVSCDPVDCLAASGGSEDKAAFMKAAILDIKENNMLPDPQQHFASSRSLKFPKAGFKPLVVPFGDWDYFYVNSDLIWEPNREDNLITITVPKGFVTNLASIPQLFWTVLPPMGRYAYAAIVHDYLYWAQPISRDEADRVFEIAMEDSGVSTAARKVIYVSVHIGGASAWRRNSMLKAHGERRILKRFPSDPLISWADWRKNPAVFE